MVEVCRRRIVYEQIFGTAPPALREISIPRSPRLTKGQTPFRKPFLVQRRCPYRPLASQFAFPGYRFLQSDHLSWCSSGQNPGLRMFRLAAFLILVWHSYYVSWWRCRRIVLPVEDFVWLWQSLGVTRVIWIWATVEEVEDTHVANGIVDLEMGNTELKKID